MRYDNWDVILFPKDSPVPIQEFRTACYISQNDGVHTLPTLACYVSSQPSSTPFRISVHSWVAPVKPSPLIESRRKPYQRVVFTAQVIVDGSRVFHGYYETGAKWPQEIVNEKRSVVDPIQINRHGPFLDFPPFNLGVLMQSSWNVRDNEGKIKHAPRDVLEQAGIAWPIHNPLYIPSLQGSEWVSTSRAHTTKARDIAAEPSHTGARNGEPHARPRNDQPPRSSQWSKIPEKDLRGGAWDPSIADMYGPTAFTKPLDAWAATPTHIRGVDGGLQKNSNQVIVTLRDDQLGQIIEAISPPKKHYSRGSVASTSALPPKMPGFAVRSSAAALARKASYSDLNGKAESKASLAPSQGSRLHDPYPDTSGIFTPQSLMPRVGRMDSDISMRDPSSVFSVAPPGHRSSPAHVPSAKGNVQSRKEGQVGVTSTLDPSQINTLLPGIGHSKDPQELAEGQCTNPIIVDGDNEFVPGHKGMSSIDSTVRLERQLFSALGEELSGFNEETLEDTQTVAMADDFDTPATKRKRQNTFGDRDFSPLSKVAKEDTSEIAHLPEGGLS